MRSKLTNLCRCLAAVVLLAPAIAAAAKLEARKATAEEIGKTVTCSVMNTEFKVAKDTPVIDYKGKSYYFCCEPCLRDFRKSPDKYASKAALAVRKPAGEEVGKSVKCAVTNTEITVGPTTPVIDYKGKSYFFCCDHCAKDFQAAPDKFAMN